MSRRATPEERFEAWLAWEATRDGFRGEEALRYMDAIRGSFRGQGTRLHFELDELMEASRLGRLVKWLNNRLARS